MNNGKQRIDSIDFKQLPAPLQQELKRHQLGDKTFPNFLKVLANAPTILEAYLAFGRILENSNLPTAIREKISLAVSELNSSEYDVAAHTKQATETQLSDEEIILCRKATSANDLDATLLRFARNVVNKRGILAEQELEEARQYKCGNALIIEVVAVIAHVHFANLINNLSNTKLDYPPIKEIAHKER